MVRNRGTIGGSLCQADAAEDLSAVCAAAKAHVIIRGKDGEREVDMEDFHVGPFMTAVGAGEILTEVRLPLFPGGGSAHEKVERRAGDWAIAAASAAVWVEGGKLSQVGIALSAVGLTTIHLTRAEDLLRGQAPSEELFAQAREIAAEDCSPTPTAAGRSTTSDISRACSRSAPCAARRSARSHEHHHQAQRPGRHATTSSRAACSCTTSARTPSCTARTGAATPPTAAPASC